MGQGQSQPAGQAPLQPQHGNLADTPAAVDDAPAADSADPSPVDRSIAETPDRSAHGNGSFAVPNPPPPTPAQTKTPAPAGRPNVVSPSMAPALVTPVPFHRGEMQTPGSTRLTPMHAPPNTPAPGFTPLPQNNSLTGVSPSMSAAARSLVTPPHDVATPSETHVQPPMLQQQQQQQQPSLEAPPPAPEVMRAWVARRPAAVADTTSVVLENTWPVSKPAKGEARIKVVCAALNPVDFKRAEGFNPRLAQAIAFPAVLGCDAAGVVESVGEGVTNIRPGERVYFHANVQGAHGTFAEYTIVKADAVSRIAPNVSFADAAAAPCAGFTAFVALFDKLRLQPGGTVVVLGGAGGVGSYAVSLAKLCGARVAATCSAGSEVYVQNLGADRTYDYRAVPPGQLADRVREDFGRIDAVFDTVGAFADAANLAMAAEVVAFGGHLCTTLPSPPSGHEPRLFSRQLSLHYVYLGGLHGADETRPVLASLGDSVMGLMSNGVNGVRLPGHVAELVQFSQLRQGLVALQQGGTRGKLVMSFVPPAVARRTTA